MKHNGEKQLKKVLRVLKERNQGIVLLLSPTKHNASNNTSKCIEATISNKRTGYIAGCSFLFSLMLAVARKLHYGYTFGLQFTLLQANPSNSWSGLN